MNVLSSTIDFNYLFLHKQSLHLCLTMFIGFILLYYKPCSFFEGCKIHSNGLGGCKNEQTNGLRKSPFF